MSGPGALLLDSCEFYAEEKTRRWASFLITLIGDGEDSGDPSM